MKTNSFLLEQEKRRGAHQMLLLIKDMPPLSYALHGFVLLHVSGSGRAGGS